MHSGAAERTGRIPQRWWCLRSSFFFVVVVVGIKGFLPSHFFGITARIRNTKRLQTQADNEGGRRGWREKATQVRGTRRDMMQHRDRRAGRYKLFKEAR